MGWKILIAALLLLWWARSAAAADEKAKTTPYDGEPTYVPPIPEPSGSVDTEAPAVTFHEQSGVWSDVWKKPAASCQIEPDEFGGNICR